MRIKPNRIALAVGAITAAAVVAAAPSALAEPIAPMVDPHCISLGGKAPQYQTPGIVQINDPVPVQQPVLYPSLGGDYLYQRGRR